MHVTIRSSAVVEANGSQTEFFADFVLISSTQACLWEKKMPQRTLKYSVTWAWWRLRDMLPAQESGAGIGCPPGQGHWDAADFSADFVHNFCVTPEHLIFWGLAPKSAQKYAQNSVHQKSAQKSAQNKISLNIPSLWKMEARKKHKRICAKLAQKPQPQPGGFLWGGSGGGPKYLPRRG